MTKEYREPHQNNEILIHDDPKHIRYDREDLRAKLEKIIWSHYHKGFALNVEALLDEIMPKVIDKDWLLKEVEGMETTTAKETWKTDKLTPKEWVDGYNFSLQDLLTKIKGYE